jgi:hypothetical protein
MNEPYIVQTTKLRDLDDELIRISAEEALTLSDFSCAEGDFSVADVRVDIPQLRLSVRCGYFDDGSGRTPVGVAIVYDLKEDNLSAFRHFEHTSCSGAVKNYLRVQDSSVPIIDYLDCMVSVFEGDSDSTLHSSFIAGMDDGELALMCV